LINATYGKHLEKELPFFPSTPPLPQQVTHRKRCLAPKPKVVHFYRIQPHLLLNRCQTMTDPTSSPRAQRAGQKRKRSLEFQKGDLRETPCKLCVETQLKNIGNGEGIAPCCDQKSKHINDQQHPASLTNPSRSQQLESLLPMPESEKAVHTT
jgi:hypothetical protein